MDYELKNIQITLQDMKALLKDLEVIITPTAQPDMAVPSGEETSRDILMKSDANMTTSFDLPKEEGILLSDELEKDGVALNVGLAQSKLH